MVENTELNELEINFKYIKRIIQGIEWSQDDIDSLITAFSKDINSKRKQSMIRNIHQLIKVLEDRCVLDPLNIVKLFVFDAKANSEKLSTIISSHQKLLCQWHKKLDCSTVKISRPEIEESFSSLRVEIPQSVIILLSQGIKYYWRDFARYLQLCEGDIDSIEETYSDSSVRIKMVFQIFESKASLMTYKDVILNSLSRIRRYDLREKVDLIFSEI